MHEELIWYRGWERRKLAPPLLGSTVLWIVGVTVFETSSSREIKVAAVIPILEMQFIQTTEAWWSSSAMPSTQNYFIKLSQVFCSTTSHLRPFRGSTGSVEFWVQMGAMEICDLWQRPQISRALDYGTLTQMSRSKKKGPCTTIILPLTMRGHNNAGEKLYFNFHEVYYRVSKLHAVQLRLMWNMTAKKGCRVLTSTSAQ